MIAEQQRRRRERELTAVEMQALAADINRLSGQLGRAIARAQKAGYGVRLDALLDGHKVALPRGTKITGALTAGAL